MNEQLTEKEVELTRTLEQQYDALCKRVVEKWKTSNYGGATFEDVLEVYLRHEGPRLIQAQISKDPALLEVLAKQVYDEYLASDGLQEYIRTEIRRHVSRVVQNRVDTTVRLAVKNVETVLHERMREVVNEQIDRAWKELAPAWMTEVPVAPENTAVDDEIRSRHIETLPLGVRAKHNLFSADIRTIGDLIDCSEKRLLEIPGMGRGSLGEIKRAIASIGLILRT